MTDRLNTLPPVSDMMRTAGLEPKKQFGQNFLFDLNLTGRIARHVPDIENSVVIEVGPGPGGLTRSLLQAGAAQVIAIEKDKATAPILTQVSDASDGRLQVIFEDALKVFANPGDMVTVPRAAICSNLPYNVGTELLIQWLHYVADKRPPIQITSMTLMFQREVAERIVARRGDKAYGRLAILTDLVADAKILFDVPNTAFVPRPKVQSAVVQVIPNPAKIEALRGLGQIEALTAKLFGQRRKMIRGIIPGVSWVDFGLTGTERAEELTPEKFAEMAPRIAL